MPCMRMTIQLKHGMRTQKTFEDFPCNCCSALHSADTVNSTGETDGLVGSLVGVYCCCSDWRVMVSVRLSVVQP